MATAEVKALCFDVFGTVVDWRASIAREAAAAFAGRGIERDWHAFADAWRARYQPAMEEVRSGAQAMDAARRPASGEPRSPSSTSSASRV